MTDYIRQIDAAIIAHDEWKARLLTAVEAGSSDVQPDEVRADDRCAFGAWLSSVGPDMKASLHYERVRDLHARFHRAAADVLKLALGGKGPLALTSLEFGSEYASASVLLVDEMELWRAELERGESGGLP
jgi:methyl-accepting chemotaxis protein